MEPVRDARPIGLETLELGRDLGAAASRRLDDVRRLAAARGRRGAPARYWAGRSSCHKTYRTLASPSLSVPTSSVPGGTPARWHTCSVAAASTMESRP